jgi:outer membrane protein TolC
MSSAFAITILMAISLQDAVTKAIAHSPELRALDAGVAEARANAELGNAFRAGASISTTPGYATGLPIAVLGQIPAIATIEAHRLLYDPSARADQIGIGTQVDAATARLESRKREIALSVVDLYARVAADLMQTESASKRVAAFETIGSRTQALRNEGRARDLDVDRATVQTANAKRIALAARNRLELDQLRLDHMVGEHVDPSGGDPSLALAMTADAELRSLEARIDAMQRAVALEHRLFKPTIAAQVQYSRLFDRYGRYYLNFKPDDLAAGATITLPIWSGGHRASAAARVNAQLQQLLAQRELRRTELDLTRREAENDLSQALAEADLASRTRAIARESLRVAEQLSKEGRGEANDVPLAQIALADSEDEVANAEAHRVTAQARLRILGGEIPQATYNP